MDAFNHFRLTEIRNDALIFPVKNEHVKTETDSVGKSVDLQTVLRSELVPRVSSARKRVKVFLQADSEIRLKRFKPAQRI